MLLIVGHVAYIQEFLIQLDLQQSEWMTKVFVVHAACLHDRAHHGETHSVVMQTGSMHLFLENL